MKKQVLALIGDYYHPADYIKKGFEKLLEDEKWSISLKFSPQDIQWEKLGEYDLFILFQMGQLNPRESKEFWMTDDIQQVLADYVNKGGGLMILHSGAASHPIDGVFRKVAKGHFLSHPQEHPVVRVGVKNTDHPIMDGVGDFEVVDELYLVEVDKNGTDVLMEAGAEGYGTSPAVWAHGYGQGKVCCIMPGHTEDVVCHEMMQRLYRNAMQWCLGL